MILTSAFSKENSNISLEEFNLFTTATRKLRVKEIVLAYAKRAMLARQRLWRNCSS